MTPQQIQTNYIESFQFLEQRKSRQVKQLILLNNLQRGDQNIASTLLLTLFNRVLASLYDDKIQVKFLPTQGITQDQLNSYNLLAQSDYQEMGKARIDYDWIWDALFFGRGYVETYQFDQKQKIMRPHVLNPLAFGYDPYFPDVQDWRYYWKWVTKSKPQIETLIKAGKITGIKSSREIASGIDPYLWQWKSERDKATKANEPPIEPADNDVYQIFEYFGYNEDGERCAFWTDKNFSKMLMEEKLELDDMTLEDGTVSSKWPIVEKESFRIPHSTVPFSIADLLEDKHRAKSVLLNLAFIAAKDKANPIYGYNPDKVKDVAQFFSRQINQHIPMEDETAAWPLNKENPMDQGLINFMTMLQQEANDPVGTGVSIEPQAGGQETATEVAIDQQLNDMAQSLQSKVLQFGEQEFWSHWFHRYSKHADDLETKIANVVGVKGVESTEVDLADFKTSYPPGVLVYSAKEAEYKNLVKRRDFMQMYPNLMQTLGPEGMKNFNKFVFFPLMIEDPSLIDIMLPKSLEEMRAEAENEALKNNEMPPVLDTDDHTIHLYLHHMSQPKTWASWFHIAEHQDKLAKQKSQMMQAEMAQMQGGDMLTNQNMVSSEQANTPQVGAERRNPLDQATPLKTEARTQLTKPPKQKQS